MVARMAKGSVQFFRPGDGVSWVSSRGRRSGVTYTGVVKDGPKGKHNYYEVSTPQGQFKVPAAMLKPAKVKPSQAKALAESGQKFDQRKEANKERRDERQLADCQMHIDTFQLMPGMMVKNRGVEGWPEVQILQVDREKGKCQVETSTAVVMNKIAAYDAFHGTNFRGLRRRGTRATTWVLANRLYPVR